MLLSQQIFLFSDANGFSIYPNPVLESFSISGITENTPITIADITGKIVLQRIIAQNETVFVGDLPQGIYIVRAADKTIKLIKR